MAPGTPKNVTITENQADVSIEDDDGAPVGIALGVEPERIAEGDVETDVTVTVTASVIGTTRYAEAKTVTVNLGDGRATFDVEIPAGADSRTHTFELTLMGDVLDEPDETLTVTGTAGDVAVSETTITIEDDDGAPVGIALGVEPERIAEGDVETDVTVTVTASVIGTTRYAEAKTVTVNLGDGRATFDVEIPAGADSGTHTFELTLMGDVLDEPDETLTVTGTAGDVAVSETTITIEDDDGAPVGIALGVEPERIAEGDVETDVTVTVTASVIGTTRYAEAKTVTVNLGDGRATFDVEIPAGADSGTHTFELTLMGDVLDEPDETLTVTGTAGDVAVSETTITIEDDDGAPVGIALGVEPERIAEGDVETDVTVTVTASVIGTTRYAEAKTVTVNLGDGRATFDVEIPAGADSGTHTFELTLMGDVLDEPDETLTVTGTAGDVAVSETRITIEDDEVSSTTVVLSLNTTTVDEDGGETMVRVKGTLDGPPRHLDTVLTVMVGIYGDSATEGGGLFDGKRVSTDNSGRRTSGTESFALRPTDDDLGELAETLTVTGTAAGFSVTGTTATIVDDDTVKQEKAAVAETLATVTAAAVSNVTTNIGARFSAARGGVNLSVAGHSMTQSGPLEGVAWNSLWDSKGYTRALGSDELLRTTAFQIALGGSGRRSRAGSNTVDRMGRAICNPSAATRIGDRAMMAT